MPSTDHAACQKTDEDTRRNCPYRLQQIAQQATAPDGTDRAPEGRDVIRLTIKPNSLEQ